MNIRSCRRRHRCRLVVAGALLLLAAGCGRRGGLSASAAVAADGLAPGGPVAASTAAQADASAFVVYDGATRNHWKQPGSGSGPKGFLQRLIGHILGGDGGGQGLIVFDHSVLATGAFGVLHLEIDGQGHAGAALRLHAQREAAPPQPSVELVPLSGGGVQAYDVPLERLGIADVADLRRVVIEDVAAGGVGDGPALRRAELRLRALPAEVQVTVHAGDAGRPVSPLLVGLNLAVFDADLEQEATLASLSAAGVRALRFPGGSGADLYHWASGRSEGGTSAWPTSSAVFARFNERLGAQAFITVNYGSGTPEEAAAWVAWANGSPDSATALGVDARGTDWKTVGYWASLRAQPPLHSDDGVDFLRLGHPAPLGWKWFEIGNEVYGRWEEDHHGASGGPLMGLAHDPLTYATSSAQFIRRMKAVDPGIKVGVVAVEGSREAGAGPDDGCWEVCSESEAVPARDGSRHRGWTPIVLTNLARQDTRPDFLVYHFYPQEPGEENDDALLFDAAMWPGIAQTLRRQIGEYWNGGGGDAIALAATEINSVTFDPGRQTVSLVNGLFLADQYRQLAGTEFVSGQWWSHQGSEHTNGNLSTELFGSKPYGTFGIVSDGASPPGTHVPARGDPYPTYRVMRQLAQWAGPGAQLLTSSSSSPVLGVGATRLADGSLAILVINKRRGDPVTAQFAVDGVQLGSAAADVSTYGIAEDAAEAGPSAARLPRTGNAFSYRLPPLSSTVIRIAAVAASERRLNEPATRLLSLNAGRSTSR